MGYRTPNIDRIGQEGAMFTDWYGEQSCTAGRAAFITGQSPIRTGLTKVGLPGADVGIPVSNDMVSHYDLIPTFCAAAGEPDIVAKARVGYQAGGKTFKVHLDGYNLEPFLSGSAKEAPRREFLYWSDDADLLAIRFQDWMIHFKIQESEGIDVWQRAFTDLRVPLIFNLRGDPFERGDSSIEYDKWMMERSFIVVPSQALVAQWLESFKEFPIRQKPASFNLDRVMEQLSPGN